MTCPRHILSEEGILTSFSIAKKVDNRLIKRLQAKAKKDGMSDEELNKKIGELIIAQTKLAIDNNEIPGLVWAGMDVNEEHIDRDVDDKKTIELTYLASLLSKKISEKNLNKYDSCYLINAMINLLGLTEDDFEDFYNKFSDEQSTDDESDSQGPDDIEPWEDEDDEDGYGRE